MRSLNSTLAASVKLSLSNSISLNSHSLLTVTFVLEPHFTITMFDQAASLNSARLLRVRSNIVSGLSKLRRNFILVNDGVVL